MAVGNGGRVLTSPDGVTWSLVDSGVAATFYGAAVGADVAVAVGYSTSYRAAVAYSMDGVTWTSATVPTLSNILRRAAYGAGRFVAVGGEGRILSSVDGKTWATVTSPTSVSLYAVHYANGCFVATGASGQLLYSADGLNWQLRNTSSTETFTALTFSAGKWIAATSSSGAIWSSSDGLTWSQSAPTGVAPVGIWDLHASSDGQLAGVAYGEVVYANSALNWAAANVTGDEDAWLNAIAEGNRTLVVVGSSGLIFQSGEPLTVAPWISDTAGFDALPVNEAVSLSIETGGATSVELWVDGVKAGEVTGDATTTTWTPTQIGPHSLVLRGVLPSGSTISSDPVTAIVVPVFVRRTPSTTETWPILHDVTYTGDMFVAVGDNGRIFISRDGVVWDDKTTSQALQFRGVAAGNGAIVAVGAGYFGTSGQPTGAGAYSTDGINWQTTTLPAGPSQYTSVAYGSGRFVAVGPDGKIAVSAGGKTWNEVVSGTTSWLYAVRYANGQFVASGSNGTILTSADGLVWTARTVDAYETLAGLAYFNNKWIVVGNNFSVWASSDGVTWERRRSGGTSSVAAPYRLISGSDGFLYGVSASRVYFTKSPENWSSAEFGLETPMTMYGIAVGNDTIVVVGGGRTILQSGVPHVVVPSFADVAANDVFSAGAEATLEITHETGATTELLVDGVAVASAAGETTAVAWTPTRFGPYNLSLRSTSADGNVTESLPVRVSVGLENWTWRHRLPFGGDLRGAAYAFGKWWVIGFNRVIMSSAGAIDWSVSEPEVGAEFTDIEASPSRLVITTTGYNYFNGGGITGSIFTSTDGTSWALAQGAIATSTNGMYAVAYSGGKWVAVGANGAIGTSNDGVTWTQQSSPVNEFLAAVASNGSTTAPLWIAVSSSKTILGSTDGQTWTVRYTADTNGLNDVAYHNGRWIVAGLNGLVLTSEDGVAWTPRTAPSSLGYSKLAVVKGALLATDSAGGVYRSADGLTWTKVYGGDSYSLNRPGIADSAAGALIVGQAGEILSSNDGLNWTLRTRGPANALRAMLKTGDRFLFAGSAVDYSLGTTTPSSPLLTGYGLDNIAPSSLRMSGYPSGTGAELYSLSYGAGVYCAVGSDGAIFTSNNGSEWAGQASGESTTLSSITYRRGSHVAVGEGGRIVVSNDGVAWTGRSSGVTAALKSVTASPRTYVAVGNAGIILSSNDGMTWTKRTSGTTANLAQVAWHPRYGFVTVGDAGVVLASTDGTVWETVSSGGYVYFSSVIATSAGFVASSYSNGLYTSQDGRSWAGSYFPVGYSINNFAIADDELVALGSFGKILSHPLPAADPRITASPQNLRLNRGQGATFTVTASGSGALSYQWLKDGVPIAGAIGAAYTIAGATVTDAGYYTVVVSNTAGDVIVSDDASLVVDDPVPTKITASPQSATRYPGQTTVFSVSATGSGTLTYQWFKDGSPLSGATNATFTIASVSAANAGAYAVTVSNGLDSATSSEARLVVKEMPAISARNGGTVVNLGGAITLDLEALEGGSFTYQWFRDGVAIPGATGTSLSLSGVTSADAGAYSVVVTNGAGSTTSQTLDLAVNGIRLSNLSIRARSGAGDRVLIAGFVIEGSVPKPLLLRGIGPTLTKFEVTNPLEDPTMTLFRNVGESSQVLALNDDWWQSVKAREMVATSTRLHAFPLPNVSLDAVLLADLDGGLYTAHVAGKDSMEGVALTEVYDANIDEERSCLVNVSARCHVGTGDDVLIAGFFVTGPGSIRLLVRGVGPTLTRYGVAGELTDPAITLHRMLSVGSEVVASANDWSSESYAAEIESVAEKVHAFDLPAGSKDAAMLVSLSEGVYTVVMSGVNDATGVGLIEVYVVP